MKPIKPFLSAEQISAWQPTPKRRSNVDPRLPLRNALIEYDHWTKSQLAGRTFAIGCVSLEVTQRCNLDCSLCYLSDLAEAVHDLPLPEIFRRVDLIADQYGEGTNVQISGGDPTLRQPDDLIAIVRRVALRRMRPSLFTNGIKATRDLLRDLSKAGLLDVAFHVDLTQARKGYINERALNNLRLDYIARARGLGLRVLFNTTVFDGNVREMPELVRFFIDHADDIQLVSFQLQADTGRGVHRAQGHAVSQQRMMADINQALGLALDFEMPRIGHPDCNKYTGIIVSNGRATPLFDDHELFADLFEAGANWRSLWHRHRAAALTAIAMAQPRLAWRGLVWLARKGWALRHGLLRTGRMTKLSFFIHNFMDAKALEKDRCANCVFMVATQDGPLSMCIHNAKRDQYVTAPIRLDKHRLWHPLTGREQSRADDKMSFTAKPENLSPKRLKGRWRAKHLAARTADRAAAKTKR